MFKKLLLTFVCLIGLMVFGYSQNVNTISSTVEFVVNTDEFVHNEDYDNFIKNTVHFINNNADDIEKILLIGCASPEGNKKRNIHLANIRTDKIHSYFKGVIPMYKITVEMTGGDHMDFFDGWKYLQDNGYDIQPASSGGKPDVWNYILIDCFVNGAAYTVVGLNPWDSNAAPQYTIVEHEAVPGTPGVDPVPASGSEGLYVDGSLYLPTKSVLASTPLATYGTQKDTTINYVSSQVDTLKTEAHEILGNALIIPQPVPQNITIVFDICIANPNGDEVVFTDRKITRTINTGKDRLNVDYVASWEASSKYIYNFKFDGDVLNFSMLVSGWETNNTEYHVWDY